MTTAAQGTPEPTPEERFERLVAAFAGRPGVPPPGADGGRGFGSNALKVGRSISAMLTRGRLVVKLPRARVAELLAAGEVEPFDAGNGKPINAAEALAFVGGSAVDRAAHVGVRPATGLSLRQADVPDRDGAGVGVPGAAAEAGPAGC